MFVSVRIYNGVSNFDEVAKQGRAGLAPRMREQPGFRAYHLVHCEDGSVRSMSCFDTREQSEAAYAITRDWVTSNLGHLVPTPPTILKGEVTQQGAIPKEDGYDSYLSFQSARGAGPKSQAVPVSRERIVPEIMKDPGIKGFYSFRDASDESHLVSVAFFQDAADAQRVHDRIWELMQERAPEVYPNKPTWVGGREVNLTP
jgi:heme-degrading monooxygenase HmoA